MLAVFLALFLVYYFWARVCPGRPLPCGLGAPPGRGMSGRQGQELTEQEQPVVAYAAVSQPVRL